MKITNVQFEDVDMKDYPDFCDAYIESCDIDGKPATEAQLEEIQADSVLWYELLTDYIH
jgi:hypothetical protein